MVDHLYSLNLLVLGLAEAARGEAAAAPRGGAAAAPCGGAALTYRVTPDTKLAGYLVSGQISG